jgi:hypothetical protein
MNVKINLSLNTINMDFNSVLMGITSIFPFLQPYLQKAGEKVAEKIAEESFDVVKKVATSEKEKQVITRIENPQGTLSQDFQTEFNELMANALNSEEVRKKILSPFSTIVPADFINIFLWIDEHEFDKVFKVMRVNKFLFDKQFEEEWTYDSPEGRKLNAFKNRLKTYLNAKLLAEAEKK